MFELDARLKQDTVVVGQWPLSILLLHKDSNFPWCILVPKLEQISEIYELSEHDQLRLFDESRLVADALVEIFAPDKLNIAALGNVVKQLHVHHIARFMDDPAWPAPVWGAVPARDYSESRLAERLKELRTVLGPKGLNC